MCGRVIPPTMTLYRSPGGVGRPNGVTETSAHARSTITSPADRSVHPHERPGLVGSLRHRPSSEARARLGLGVRRSDVVVVFASDLDVEARAAVSVTGDDGRALRVGAVSVAPLHEPHQGRHQVDPLRRDHVPESAARAGLAVCLGGQDAVLDEFAEPLGKQVARTAEDALEVAEAGSAVPDLPEDQDRPLLAHHLQGSRDRAVRRVSVEPDVSTRVHGATIQAEFTF